jgi:hypothetical protein
MKLTHAVTAGLIITSIWIGVSQSDRIKQFASDVLSYLPSSRFDAQRQAVDPYAKTRAYLRRLEKEDPQAYNAILITSYCYEARK